MHAIILGWQNRTRQIPELLSDWTLIPSFGTISASTTRSLEQTGRDPPMLRLGAGVRNTGDQSHSDYPRCQGWQFIQDKGYHLNFRNAS